MEPSFYDVSLYPCFGIEFTEGLRSCMQLTFLYWPQSSGHPVPSGQDPNSTAKYSNGGASNFASEAYTD